MIELKATTAQEIVRNEKDCDYMDELFGGVKMPPTQVYLKSEADNVIEELKKEKKYAIDNVTKVINAQEREIRHQKYKRCLDKAMWCESEENRLEAIAPIFDTDKECWEYNSDYWVKWRQRWLKIAEKFKNKETE